MEEDRTTFARLEAAFIDGRLSRRDLLRRSALVGATASAMSLLASLGLSSPARAQDKPKRGGTLVIAKESELDILDPHSAGGWVTWRVSKQMHEGHVVRVVAAAEFRRTQPPGAAARKPAMALRRQRSGE